MKYLKNKIFWLIILILAIGLFVTNIFFNKNGFDTFLVQRKDLNQSIIISGKIVPAQEVDLSFEVSGLINNVAVDIGDEVIAGQVLARIDSSEITNEISESQAQLDSQLSQLNELTSGNQDESQTLSSKQQLLSVLKKSYITADDIVRNKVDIFFTDPNSRFPEFTKSLSDYFLRQDLNEERFEVGKLLEDWEVYNSNLEIGSVKLTDSEYNIESLREIENLLEIISNGSVDFSPTSSVTQSQIDAYISTISSARNSVASLIVEINQTSESLRDIQSNIPVQQAAVRNAEANLQKLNSRTSKYFLVAPFDGVITEREIEVGEVSEIGKTAISIIGNGDLEIETFIPEVLIAGVDVSDLGKAQLDAFGDLQRFDVFVAHVDPRETEKDGLVTYRTLVDFTNPDERIRPGMSAEVEIIKQQISNTFVIPTHLIQEDTNGLFVEILEKGDAVRKEITVGLEDGKGSIAVISGISENDLVIVPKNN
jgi:RND family efflux transporter MFP subunit